MKRRRQLGTLLLLLLPATATATATEATGDGVAELARRFEIEIVVTGEEASGKEVARYLPLLREELSRYPPAFRKKTHLKRVILSSDLDVGGQARFNFPDHGHHTISIKLGRGYLGHVRRTIHHEIFHVVDFVDDGRIESDQEWEALNPRGFEYGDGGRSMLKDEGAGELRTGRPGFLNRYSTSGVEEDKAVIYSYLAMDPELLMEKAAKDPVITRKVELLKSQLLRFNLEAGDLWRPSALQEFHRARREGTPVLVLFTSGDVSTRLIDETLSDERVRAALSGWAFLCFDLDDPTEGEFGRRLGVERAPALRAWKPGRRRSVRHSTAISPASLAELLERRAKAD